MQPVAHREARPDGLRSLGQGVPGLLLLPGLAVARAGPASGPVASSSTLPPARRTAVPGCDPAGQQPRSRTTRPVTSALDARLEVLEGGVGDGLLGLAPQQGP